MLLLFSFCLQLLLGHSFISNWNLAVFKDPTCRYPSLVHSTSVDFNIQSLLDEKDSLRFSSTIKGFAAKHYKFEGTQRIEILNLMLKHLDSMNSEAVSNIIWSLGILQFTSIDLSDNFLTIILDSATKVFTDGNFVSTHRACVGLGKLGIDWNALSSIARSRALETALFLNVDSNNQSNARSIPTFLYSLGQMRANISTLPDGTSGQLQVQLASALRSGAVEPQGLANAAWGLARIGIAWRDLSPEVSGALLQSCTTLAPAMRVDELSSFLQSLVTMQLSWQEMPADCQDCLVASLRSSAPAMRAREVASALWSLGKLHAHWEALDARLHEALLARLEHQARSLPNFDLESALVGLGLMQVNFRSLSPNLQKELSERVAGGVSSMNIFCVRNVLWGLARMGVRANEPTEAAVSVAVVDRVLELLHSFLPEHYGDLVWSMGSLGCSAGALSQERGEGRARLQAVLSRVLGKLPARDGVYVLWGLGKMGLRWANLTETTQSQPDGRQGEPLSESIGRFLKVRIGGLKEQDYAVLCYSLGLLHANWTDLSPEVRGKMLLRGVRMSQFLAPRSLSTALWGLGRLRIPMSEMGPVMWVEWEQLLSGPRGLVGMSALEVVQAVHGLGMLGVPWGNLSDVTKAALTGAVNDRVPTLPDHGVRTLLWAFSEMQCPYSALPVELSRKVLSLFSRPQLSGRSVVGEDGDGDGDVEVNVEGDGDEARAAAPELRLTTALELLRRCGARWESFAEADRSVVKAQLQRMAKASADSSVAASAHGYDEHRALVWKLKGLGMPTSVTLGSAKD